MDPCKTYQLMSQRFYDPLNGKVHIPDELYKYFQKLGSKQDDKFIEECISFFVESTPDNYRSLEKDVRLDLEEEGYVDFKINSEIYDLPYRLLFRVPERDNSKKNCVVFTWFPFNKTIYIDNLLLKSGSRQKMDVNKECSVKDIPKKSGEFFLKKIESIGKKLGVKKIILEDASRIFMEDGTKINLALYYLKEHGTTYYGKYGYKPIRENLYNSYIFNDIMFNLNFPSANDDVKYIKSQLKKMKDLDLVSTIREFKKYEYYLPRYYLKKI